jgi:hypothetical protein
MLLDLITAPHHAQTTSYAGFGFLSFARGSMFWLTRKK